MVREKDPPRSLVEQIIDEMFASLEAHPEFNADVIQELKRLAQTGDLKKAAYVTKAIKFSQTLAP
jgi:hypothetical protein